MSKEVAFFKSGGAFVPAACSKLLMTLWGCGWDILYDVLDGCLDILDDIIDGCLDIRDECLDIGGEPKASAAPYEHKKPPPPLHILPLFLGTEQNAATFQAEWPTTAGKMNN